MSPKMVDFLSSFGVMVAGVAILFFGSVSFSHSRVEPVVRQFPLSQERVVTEPTAERKAMFPVSRPAVPTKRDPVEFANQLTAASVVVVDDRTNTVLFKKDSTEIRSLASITKLMTALVLMDLPINWSSTTIITEEDIDDHQLLPGEKYTLESLWHTALVGSSNSAIHALVAASGLTESQFVERMNQKAKEFGLLSLRFVEPTGLDNRNMGTAQDIAKLLKEALALDKIRQTLGSGQFTAKPLNKKTEHLVWSTNWLLNNWVPNSFNKKLLVGKTGFINDSGYNFAVRIADDADRIIRVVVLGAASNEFRFSEARDVAAWVFDHYIWPEDHYATAVE